MTQPFDCPIPADRSCPHTMTIAQSQAQMATILSTLAEIKSDVKDLKGIAPEIKSQHEALERAFLDIEKLEKKLTTHENLFQQFNGMKNLAMGLWTVLAGGLGLVILKVFSVFTP